MKKLSFVVIAYNEEKNILNTLSSILNQDGLDRLKTEIIVVNDGSTDNTLNILNDFSNNKRELIIIDSKTNRGRGSARYEGIKKAKGELIVLVDADIKLQNKWLKIVTPYLKDFDGVGGIALPDGDITFISQRFHLSPKLSSHTTGITGSNVVYKRSIFKKVFFNEELRGGEDTDFNWRLENAGFKSKLVSDLVSVHQEDINFTKSLKRMYSFGKGATNLLNKHKRIRLPDVSFFMFIVFLMFSALFVLKGIFYLLILTFIFPLFISFFHLFKKFKFENKINFYLAGLVNYFMILFYFAGRISGFFSKE